MIPCHRNAFLTKVSMLPPNPAGDTEVPTSTRHCPKERGIGTILALPEF